MSKAANTARLKKLHDRAKSIIRKHPGKKYGTALKQAGAEMRSGKIRSAPKKKSMPKKKHYAKATKRHSVRRPARKVSGAGVMTKSRTHTDYNRNKVNITVGAVNKHKKAAREKILHLIGREEVKKFTAKLKRVKKKVGKKITRLKADYRRLAI